MDKRPERAKAALAAHKAARVAKAPLYEAIKVAQATGNRDAWRDAVNVARRAEGMGELTRGEFDARFPH